MNVSIGIAWRNCEVEILEEFSCKPREDEAGEVQVWEYSGLHSIRFCLKKTQFKMPFPVLVLYWHDMSYNLQWAGLIREKGDVACPKLRFQYIGYPTSLSTVELLEYNPVVECIPLCVANPCDWKDGFCCTGISSLLLNLDLISVRFCFLFSGTTRLLYCALVQLDSG